MSTKKEVTQIFNLQIGIRDTNPPPSGGANIAVRNEHIVFVKLLRGLQTAPTLRSEYYMN